MSEITLEMVETVIKGAGVGYYEAKQALIDADGDTEAAIAALKAASAAQEDAAAEEDTMKKAKKTADEAVDKLKAAVRRGNVDRIVISRKGETLINIPVNLGIIGGVIGVAAVPWAVVAAAIAAYGFSCKIEVVKNDGSREDI